MVATAVLAVVLSFSLAGVASAQVFDPTLTNSEQPGSLIVFPKFSRGFAAPGTGLAASVFEIGVVCPNELLRPGGCNLNQNFPIKLHLEWVCPGTVQKGGSSFCQSQDFELHTTLFGKIQFDANGRVTVAPDDPGALASGIPTPSCNEGYLIAWVVNATGNEAISFNGLVGEEVLRERGGSASALNGVTFQSPQPVFQPTDVAPRNSSLDFNGVEYLRAPGRIAGDVRYERLSNPQVLTSVILLTLDVRQNNDNPNVRVPVRLYRADESSFSTSLHFTCWREQRLTEIEGGPFNQARMGEKGLIASVAPAVVANACSGPSGVCTPDGSPVTVLGFVQTIERSGTAEYAYYLYGQGEGVTTTFYPFGDPIAAPPLP
jgi:hypothetical protein